MHDMNVLFFTLVQFKSLQEKGIYTDLLREFVKNGHQVYAISPVEKRQNQKTHLIKEENATIFRLRIGNTQKTNFIEKGISTVMIDSLLIKGIKRYFSKVKFDLVMYPTPPITIYKAVKYIKKRDHARTYLMLKDIFPQNAVDIGMLSKTGIKGILYKSFRKKEKRLYQISDKIGCMSRANMDYVIKHNPEIEPIKIELCPNSIEAIDKSIDAEERRAIRKKYNLPLHKMVFVYGGNLGKPQGIDFIIECLKSQMDNDRVFFLIVGSGTEYGKIEKFIQGEHPPNVALYQWLPKEDYDKVAAACDVGLIFLDHRFTIPNFPSRLLSYMQVKLPILAVTDSTTDIGSVITGIDKNGNKTHEAFGWWCESNSIHEFESIVEEIVNHDNTEMGKVGYTYLERHYTVSKSYKKISSI